MSEIKKLAKELQEYTRIVGSHNEHIQSVANRLVELTDQPQLNENQQIVLEYLKKICPPILQSPMVTIFCLMDDIINDNWRCYHDIKPEYIDKAENLSKVEQFEILKAFAEWGLERETE